MTGDGMVRHVGEPPIGARIDEPRVEDGYLLLVGRFGTAGALMEMIIVIGALVFGLVVRLHAPRQQPVDQRQLATAPRRRW